jgi:hypothetical protein
MFNEGVQRGRATRIQGTQDSALAALARDPSNQSALAGLAGVNPELSSRMEANAARRAEAERLAERQRGLMGAYDATTGRMDPAKARAAYVGAGDIEGAMEFDAHLANASESQLKAVRDQVQTLSPMLDGVTDEASFQRAREAAAGLGIDMSAVPPQYDPAWIERTKLQYRALAGAVERKLRTVNPGDVVIDEATNQPVYTSPYAPTVTAGGVVYERLPGGGTSGGGNGQPRGIRNNNPGNIEDGQFAKSQPGYKGSDGRFAIFDSPGAGERAAAALVSGYIGMGVDTPAEIVNRWAPPGENSLESRANYAAHIARTLGIGVNDKVSPAMAAKVVQAQREFENGTWQGGGGVRPLTPPKAEDKPKPSETRVHAGKTYYKVNGRWYDNAEGI